VKNSLFTSRLKKAGGRGVGKMQRVSCAQVMSEYNSVYGKNIPLSQNA
jgi:hypothetical protein